MKLSGVISIPIVCCLSFLVGCTPSEKTKALMAYEQGLVSYADALEEELQREEMFDSLFHGIRFKMTQNTFFDYVQKKHLEGLFTANSSFEIVIDISEGFKRPVNFVFYPKFNKPFIELIPARFSYVNVNLFDKNYGSGVLIQEVAREMMKWYRGRNFIEIPPRNLFERPSLIKIDGNRKIVLKENESQTEVIAIYYDLKPLY